MKIAFDAKRLFLNNTGLGNYSRTIIRNLAQIAPDIEFFLFTPKIVENESTAFFIHDKRFTIRTPDAGFYPLWRQWGIGSQLDKDDIDIYHGLSHEIPMQLAMPDKVKTVVSFHDLIFIKYPELFPWIDRKLYFLKYKRAVKNANRIIAISESTKRDLIKEWKINPDKIDVIYQSGHPDFYHTPPLSDTRSHFLYVGSLIERKGLHDIIKALYRLDEDMRRPLVVIGSGKAYADQAHRLVRDLGLEKFVVFKGNVPNHELIKYYDQAIALIYPSLYEGFGIPILEANLRKVPVICSDVSSMPEAAGPHASYVKAGDVDGIYRAMHSIVFTPEKYINKAEKSYNYSLKLCSPDATAKQLLLLYEEVISDSG